MCMLRYSAHLLGLYALAEKPEKSRIECCELDIICL
jgi:hypothetical protein